MASFTFIARSSILLAVLLLVATAVASTAAGFDWILGLGSVKTVRDEGLHEFLPQSTDNTTANADLTMNGCVGFLGEYDSGVSFLANNIFESVFPSSNDAASSSFGIGMQVVPFGTESDGLRMGILDVQGFFYEHGLFDSKFATESALKSTIAKTRCDIVIVGDSLNRQFVELFRDMVAKVWQNHRADGFSSDRNIHVIFNSMHATKAEELMYELRQLTPKLDPANFPFANANNELGIHETSKDDVGADCRGLDSKDKEVVFKANQRVELTPKNQNWKINVETHVIGKVSEGAAASTTGDGQLMKCLIARSRLRVRETTSHRLVSEKFDLTDSLARDAAATVASLLSGHQYHPQTSMPSKDTCLSAQSQIRGGPTLSTFTTDECVQGSYKVAKSHHIVPQQQQKERPPFATFDLTFSLSSASSLDADDIVYVRGPGCARYNVTYYPAEAVVVFCEVHQLDSFEEFSSRPAWHQHPRTGTAQVKIDIIDWNTRYLDISENHKSFAAQNGILELRFPALKSAAREDL